MPIKHLTNEELDEVMRFTQWTLDFLGLGNIQVIVRGETAGEWNEEEPDDEGNTLAGIECAEQKHTCDLFLTVNWHGLPDVMKASCILHEMLHVLHKRVDWMAYEPMDSELLPIRSGMAWKDSYHQEMELFIDRIVRVMLPQLPPWADASKLPDARTVVRQGEHI